MTLIKFLAIQTILACDRAVWRGGIKALRGVGSGRASLGASRRAENVRKSMGPSSSYESHKWFHLLWSVYNQCIEINILLT